MSLGTASTGYNWYGRGPGGEDCQREISPEVQATALAPAGAGEGTRTRVVQAIAAAPAGAGYGEKPPAPQGWKPTGTRCADQADGQALKRSALSLLEQRRGVHLNRARRAFLQAVLEKGEATADDAYPAAQVLADLDPRVLGAVPGPLALSGIIEAAGFVASTRPQRHRGIVRLWRLKDRTAAIEWLAEHLDEPEPAGAGHNTWTLFAQGEP